MKVKEDLIEMICNLEFIVKSTSEQGTRELANETLQILKKYNGEEG